MDVSPIIARLQAQMTGQGWVELAGVADLDSAIESVTPVAPAAYVMPLGEQASESPRLMQQRQTVRQRFGVVIVVSSYQDATGEAANADLSIRRKQVRDALLGYSPSATSTPCAFASGRLLQFGGGRLWWVDEYSVSDVYSQTS
jgi:hypothetical protein